MALLLPQAPMTQITPEQLNELAGFQSWLQAPEKAGRDYSSASISFYVSGLKRLFAILFKIDGYSTAPIDLTPLDVVRARDVLINDGLSGSAVNKVVYAAKLWAKSQGDHRARQYENIKGIRASWMPGESLTDSEYNRLLRTLDQECVPGPVRNRKDVARRDLAAFALYLGAGLRREEGLNVLIQDLELSSRAGWVHVRSGKGRKERRAPIPARFRGWLQDRIDEITESSENYDHLQPILGHITPDGIYRRITHWGERARIDKLTPHVLRRTRGRRWRVKSELRLEVVQQFLGHSDINTTMMYTVSDEDLLGADGEILNRD